MKKIHVLSFMLLSGQWRERKQRRLGFAFIAIVFVLSFIIASCNPVYATTTENDETKTAAENSEDTADSSDRNTVHSRANSDHDETNASEWLEVKVEILFEQSDWLSIDINYKIHEMMMTEPYGQITADEIRKIYDIEQKTETGEPPIINALYQKINEISEIIVNKTTQSATQIFYDPVREISSFIGTIDEDIYDPPVVINQYIRLKLSELAYFTSSEISEYNIQNLNDLIDGSLKMGAKVTTDFTLYAGAGYYMTYIIRVEKYESWSENYPGQLKISHPNDDNLPKKTDHVKFQFNNLNTLYSSVRPIRGVTLLAEEPNVQLREILRYDLSLDLQDFDALVINQSSFIINSVSIRPSMMRLPSNISGLNFLSTDGIRLFLDNGLIQLSDLESGLASEFSRLEKQLAKVFNTTTNVNFDKYWELSTLFNMDPLYHLTDIGTMRRMGTERAIIGHLSSPDVLQPRLFGNTTANAVKGLLNTGARAILNVYISVPYSYSYNFSIPIGYELIGRTPTNTNIDDGNGYTYTIKPKQSPELYLEALKHPKYTSSLANINVTIDIHEVDIQGYNEYLASVKITANGALQYIRNEAGSKFDKALPKGITMDYYNSDALRLVYTEGLLDIIDIEDSLYSMIQENISNLLEENVKMFVAFNEELLEFDGDITRMDGSAPVRFAIRSSGKMRITGDRLVRMGGFVTKRLELPLPGAKYWNISYKLILPEHIHILGQPEVLNGSMEYSGPVVDRNSENRDELYMTLYGESTDAMDFDDESLEVNVKVDIDITLWFFISKIIIPIVLFIILCVLIVVIKIYRRHKLNKISKLKDDPDLVIEEEEPKWSFGGRGLKREQKAPVIDKDKYVRELPPDESVPEDYAERLEELMPRHAIRNKRGIRKSRGRGRGRTKGKFESRVPFRRSRRDEGKGKRKRSTHDQNARKKQSVKRKKNEGERGHKQRIIRY
jgi:hypothetical protein